MVSKLLDEFEHKIEDITVIPSRGGVFEVIANDDLIYSKKATGEHAEYEDVAAPLRDKLAAV
ncbi:MAG: hypothetical protein HKN91_09000 [Acidimicrobiia bacterium]|nr:hypothetical protein [Acidimicrobiia bacterium]